MTVKARALWLVPGLQHPLLPAFVELFSKLFEGFHTFDYREKYLTSGARALLGQLRQDIANHAVDVIIYSQFPNSYSYIAPSALNELRQRCVVVGLGFDDEIWFEQSKFFYQCCDAVVTTDPSAAAWLKQIGVAVHVASLQQPHQQGRAGLAEDIPVSFVGDINKPGRRQYIERLERAGVPVADFGAGTRNGRISADEVLEVFGRSKINLNFTATNPPEWIRRYDPLRARFGQVKGRAFELAAIERFCLSEWAPSLDYWFRPSEEIGVFVDGNDLVAKAKFYLENDAIRRAIASAAHARFQRDFVLETQLDRIFTSILGAGRRDRTEFTARGNALFFESMGRSRGVALLHVLKRGAPLRAIREPFTPWSNHFSFWRGIAGGVGDALISALRKG